MPRIDGIAGFCEEVGEAATETLVIVDYWDKCEISDAIWHWKSHSAFREKSAGIGAGIGKPPIAVGEVRTGMLAAA